MNSANDQKIPSGQRIASEQRIAPGSGRGELQSFRPRFQFFVGVDYDGTIFDSMTIKHREVFIPVFLESWEVGSHQQDLRDIWEEINLYSGTRGINRYAGLLSAFEQMSALTTLPDYGSLREFVNSGEPLSAKALKAYMAEHPSDFLNQVCEWSVKSDQLFQALMDGRQPFLYAREALKLISGKADIMVISSASSKSIVKDLTDCSLIELISMTAGQEMGGKVRQLTNGTAGKYQSRNILMIGDSPGDREAAGDAGVLFYPIIPGRESQSWKKLLDEGFGKFTSGEFAGRYEETLIQEFEETLGL